MIPVIFSLFSIRTSTMREFLKRLAETSNPKLKRIPKDKKLAKINEKEMFSKLKTYLSRGIPVIVHQYWKGKKSNGHYRLVTGYDDAKKEVYLNDANPGTKTIQSYSQFLKRWNVDEPWLHYNSIVFNVNKSVLDFKIQKFNGKKS